MFCFLKEINTSLTVDNIVKVLIKYYSKFSILDAISDLVRDEIICSGDMIEGKITYKINPNFKQKSLKIKLNFHAGSNI